MPTRFMRPPLRKIQPGIYHDGHGTLHVYPRELKESLNVRTNRPWAFIVADITEGLLVDCPHAKIVEIHLDGTKNL